MNNQFGNPMQIIEQMAQVNPEARQILQAMKSGKTPEDIAREMMKQRGINPDQFMNNLFGNMYSKPR